MLKTINKILVGLAVIFSLVLWNKYSKDAGIFYGDALGYHAYLPSAIINGNLDHIQDLQQDTSIDEAIRNGMSNWQYSYSTNEEGNVIIQYTYGVAAMNLPLFIAGHAATLMSNQSANGFSYYYTLAIKLAGFLYGLFGFYLLWKVLTSFFEKEKVNFVLLTMYLGTNLFWFMVIQAGMAHVQIFFLYALILFSSHKYYTNYQKKWAFLTAFAIGLLTVIRPTDVISVIIPFLYGVTSWTQFQERLLHLKKHFSDVIIPGMLIFIIPILPQMIYWHHMTGDWIYYSYQEQGFDFLHPKILEGLFGPRNGWITYSPLMILGLIGVIFQYKKLPLGIVNALLIPLYIFIIYSWWCYNYINGFGSRPMIHVYPLLAFAIVGLFSKNKTYNSILYAVMMLLMLVNVNYTVKALRGHIFTDESTHAFNFNTFFKHEIDANDLLLRDVEIKQVELKQPQLVLEITTADSLKYRPVFNHEHEAFHINDTIEYSPFKIEHKFSTSEITENEYLKIGGEFMAPKLVYNVYNHQVLVVTITRGEENLHWYGIKLNNKIGKDKSSVDVQVQNYNVGVWGDVFFTMPLDDIREGDVLKCFIWNPDRKEILVRSLELYIGNAR